MTAGDTTATLIFARVQLIIPDDVATAFMTHVRYVIPARRDLNLAAIEESHTMCAARAWIERSNVQLNSLMYRWHQTMWWIIVSIFHIVFLLCGDDVQRVHFACLSCPQMNQPISVFVHVRLHKFRRTCCHWQFLVSVFLPSHELRTSVRFIFGETSYICMRSLNAMQQRAHTTRCNALSETHQRLRLRFGCGKRTVTHTHTVFGECPIAFKFHLKYWQAN